MNLARSTCGHSSSFLPVVGTKVITRRLAVSLPLRVATGQRDAQHADVKLLRTTGTRCAATQTTHGTYAISATTDNATALHHKQPQSPEYPAHEYIPCCGTNGCRGLRRLSTRLQQLARTREP